jgi:uncharacterized membrane protein HdeD (DUF308 family)
MGHESARFSARYWPVPIARAAVAAVAALVVTFVADHSPAVGLGVFGSFALLSGLVVLVGARRVDRTRLAAGLIANQGAMSVVVGITALVTLAVGASLTALVVLAVTAASELIVGLRVADASPASRDHVVVAAATALLAVVLLLVRDDGVFVVGAIGAYAAIVAVYLAIAGLSLKWDTTHAASGSAVES